MGTARDYCLAAMELVRTADPTTPISFPPGPIDPRAAKILARTMYKDMVGHGLATEQILAVASELIAQVTQELKQSNDTPEERA